MTILVASSLNIECIQRRSNEQTDKVLRKVPSGTDSRGKKLAEYVLPLAVRHIQNFRYSPSSKAKCYVRRVANVEVDCAVFIQKSFRGECFRVGVYFVIMKHRPEQS